MKIRVSVWPDDITKPKFSQLNDEMDNLDRDSIEEFCERALDFLVTSGQELEEYEEG